MKKHCARVICVMMTFFWVFPANGTMTGGDYEISGDTFSVIDGAFQTGGNYQLTGNIEQTAVGTKVSIPATGSVTFTGDIFGFGEQIIISDGLHSVTFFINNWAGSLNAQCLSGAGGFPPPFGDTPPCDNISVDVGGGNNTPAQAAARLAESISSSNHNLGVAVTSVAGGTVYLQNVISAGTLGNVAMTEVGDSGDVITLVGMSGGSNAGYELRGGFQAMEQGVIGVSLNESSIALGELSAASVATGTVVASVTTTAPTGYSLTMQDDGNLRSGANDIDDVTDGSVTAGSEEYGFITSGQDAVILSDTAITTSDRTIAKRTIPTSGIQTTIQFRASLDSTQTKQGTYSHAIVFSSTVNP